MPDRQNPNESEIDFEEFQAWLEATAADEGREGESLLEQLMSTYWILRELSDILDETEEREALTRDRSPTPETDDRDTESQDELIDLLSTVLKLKSGSEGQHGFSPPAGTDHTQRQIEEPQYYQQPMSVPPHLAPPHPTQIEATLENIETELSDLATTWETELEDEADEETDRLEGRQAALEELTAERFAAIDGKLELLNSELWDAIESNAGEVAAHTELIERLRTRTADLATDLDRQAEDQDAKLQRISDHLEEFHGAVHTLRDRYADLDEHVDELGAAHADTAEAFEGHVGMFNERQEANEHRFDTLLEVLDARFDHVLDGHAANTQLAQLLETAHAQGIDHARCENCKESIDLGLLTRPSCPTCDHLWRDIDTERSFLRTRPILRTMRPGSTIESKSVRETFHDFMNSRPAEDE